MGEGRKEGRGGESRGVQGQLSLVTPLQAATAISAYPSPTCFFLFFFWRQLIKSPWARCLGQVFKHKGKSIPPPARLSLAGGSALISPLVAFIWRRGRILLVSASSVNGQMSRSPQWAEGIVEPLVSSVAAAPEDNRLIW